MSYQEEVIDQLKLMNPEMNQEEIESIVFEMTQKENE